MPNVIGLDMGTSSIRAVEISKNPKNKGVTLERAVICDKCIEKEPKKQVEKLKHFIGDANFSTKDAVVALPEAHVFSTILNLPFSTDKEIKNYLELEGGKIFPKPMSELVYSYAILGTNAVNKGEVDVNVVASGKEYVTQVFDTAKSAGLHVLAVESEAYATVRALLRGQNLSPNDTILVVHVGSLDADMMVIRNGFVRFSRNVTLGGVTFTKAISQGLDITDEQAEEYKKSYGLDSNFMEGKVINALKPVAEILINEIKRTVNFYITRNSYCEFKKVIYSGGAAVMPGLLMYSAGNLGMEVELANPFVNMNFSSRTAKQKDNLINLGPVYTVAVGLALK